MNNLGGGNGVFVIAEIGINHNGDINIAKKLIDMAKDCGCNAVKFQKRTIDIVYTKEFLDSSRESPWGTTQRAQKLGLEFGNAEYDEIDSYCKEKDIAWFASAWDKFSLIFLNGYDILYNKVASPMLANADFVADVASFGKLTFISTGMSDGDLIDSVVKTFKAWNCPFVLTHCVSTYPCRDEDCNLKVLDWLKSRYNCEVGYSGHEVGVLPSVLAVAYGATVLERHITLDRAMYGSDQAASLECRGLEIVVRYARDVKKIIGDGVKRILPGEEINAQKLRYFDK